MRPCSSVQWRSSTYADVEREFSVDDFDSVTVSQGINLNLVMGSAPSVTAVAEKDSDLDRLEIEVDEGELVIRRGSWVSGLFSMGKSRGSVTVNVVASELQAVASSSGANADLIDITCADLEVDASSGSRIEVSGSCDTVAIDASSGASVDSSDLITIDASVDSSSGASIRCSPARVFAVMHRADQAFGYTVIQRWLSQKPPREPVSICAVMRKRFRHP